MANYMINQLSLLGFFLGIGVFFSPLEAAPAASQGKVPECNHSLLVAYFPEPFVEKTLNKFQIPQAQRGAIKQELMEKNNEVAPMVEERAERMEKNPLRDPNLRQEAIKIFRETLYELFAKVMQAHGINDKDEIQAMLDDVQQQKAEYFSQCMEHSPARPPEKKPESLEESEKPATSFSRPSSGYYTDYEDQFYN